MGGWQKSFGVIVLLASFASWQPAVAEEDAVAVELVAKALKGDGVPRLVAKVRAPLADLVLELERSDGTTVKKRTGRIGAGTSRSFDLPQTEGSFRYQGRLVARFARGAPREMVLDFETHLFGPPKLTLTDDAGSRPPTVRFQSDREPPPRAQGVRDDDRSCPKRSTSRPSAVHRSSSGGAPEHAVVLRIAFAFTTAGYFQASNSSHGRSRPHEDVLSKRPSEILGGERPKLDAALTELANAVARYGRVAKVQLFVAGHTDTVGTADDNRRLSSERALQIARYFRQRGLRIGIQHAGLGEDGLLVATPDETPEPKNRRASYTSRRAARSVN